MRTVNILRIRKDSVIVIHIKLMSVVSELIMVMLVNTSYLRDVCDVHRVLDVCNARKVIHDGVDHCDVRNDIRDD
jgi:hypothetical protein